MAQVTARRPSNKALSRESTMVNVSQCKLVMLGASSSGKTSLVSRYINGQFFEQCDSTIGASFLTKTVQLDQDSHVHFDIWDTAGQERFRAIVPMYYRGAHAAILVYDITRQDSYEQAKWFAGELNREHNGPSVVALAGNKEDLRDFRQEAEAFANNSGMIFMETSAKTGKMVDELFFTIAHSLSEKDLDASRPPPRFPEPLEEKEKSSCCRR